MMHRQQYARRNEGCSSEKQRYMKVDINPRTRKFIEEYCVKVRLSGEK